MAESSGSPFAYNTANAHQFKSFKTGAYGPTFSVGKPVSPSALPLTSSTSSSSASSTTWPQQVNHAEHTPAAVANNDSNSSRLRPHLTEEENKIVQETSAKITSSLAGDHLVTLFPDVDNPFVDGDDVVKRLLPYHVYQQPQEDLQYVMKAARWSKGKSKATEVSALREEIAETRFAIQCFKRQKALEERFRRARIKAGKRKAPDDQAYILAQAMLESERNENIQLNAELRSARSELEKIEREKRLQSAPPRPSYYPQPAGSSYVHHYRPYPYSYTPTYTPTQSYTQQYGAPPPGTPVYSPAPTPAPLPAPTPAPTQSTDSSSQNPVPSGPVPVQLPVSSLPELQRIGIIPVPVSSVKPAESPPAAILKHFSGGMVYLDVNVGLLQPAQMSGLAILLNTLMARGTTAQSTSSGGSSVASPPVVAPLTDAGGPSGQ
ncbi:hypothetical protein GLOTRDRAFT_137623 [Gloeophyllum trabeum ATCC 11539]|uniref:GLTSCR protein conserved domain-containing protein n=1 Tax=Gloeophyllum trabeum (strain ATCC 11539 / FP-39264 / Madison 617) TaxID=670483 RepID=S7QD31_GLOTA|nr:uncharacterized protein GLOTRDRAFT_137623 [Gloeophyllum trabeum ATCC 11539]EPQ57252.1 hypothetical protein GLOTRDRAFT_137623 [Gloeophyllum trabeum ATCC 11539]